MLIPKRTKSPLPVAPMARALPAIPYIRLCSQDHSYCTSIQRRTPRSKTKAETFRRRRQESHGTIGPQVAGRRIKFPPVTSLLRWVTWNGGWPWRRGRHHISNCSQCRVDGSELQSSDPGQAPTPSPCDRGNEPPGFVKVKANSSLCLIN
jgi:hypothetical protein